MDLRALGGSRRAEPTVDRRVSRCCRSLIFSGGVFFFINLRYTRQLSKNTEDLHGSARWADEDDVKNTGLLDAEQGVYVGGWHDDKNRHLHYLRHNGPEHVLAFAPTRTGKGVALVIPTLLAWSESAIIYDIKGENWQKTAGFRTQAGHLCLKFSPVEQRTTAPTSTRWKKCALVHHGTCPMHRTRPK